MNVSPLLRATHSAYVIRRNLNCWTAALTKPHRVTYVRTYPTALVLPDGSSITISYYEPRRIIKIPLDINTLDQHARQERVAMRTPLKKVTIQDQDDSSDFDASMFYKK